MGIRYLGTNSPDGTSLGYTTGEKVGLYGNVTTQPSGGSQAAVRTTALNTTNTGNATSTTIHGEMVSDINALKVLTNKMRSDLVALGVIKGS